MSADYTLRTRARAGDVAAVRQIVSTTGFFSDEETAVAGELIEEWLTKKAESGYYFIFAEAGKQLVGYCCFGPVPLTRESFDLYWIAVAPQQQGRGLGRRLMAAAEERIYKLGGTRIYADTSSREQYLPTRSFYEALGYRQAASLPDFYAPGDGKVVYCKNLGYVSHTAMRKHGPQP